MNLNVPVEGNATLKVEPFWRMPLLKYFVASNVAAVPVNVGFEACGEKISCGGPLGPGTMSAGTAIPDGRNVVVCGSLYGLVNLIVSPEWMVIDFGKKPLAAMLFAPPPTVSFNVVAALAPPTLSVTDVASAMIDRTMIVSFKVSSPLVWRSFPHANAIA